MLLALLKAIHPCVCSHRNVPSINFIATVYTKDLRVFYWKCLKEEQIIVMKIKYCYTIVCFPCLILKRTFFLTSVKFLPVCFGKCTTLVTFIKIAPGEKFTQAEATGAKPGPQHLYLKRKDRQYLGCWEAMTFNAIFCTYKFFQDNSLELFKDGSPRKQDFNPIYFLFFINLHVLLTKCPNSTSCALESHGGRNNSQSNIKQRKTGQQRNLEFKETQNLWHNI